MPEAFTGLNRIPILMLGPLLHRTGEAFVPLVGGDPIGRRPVDFHVAALRALGAEVEAGPAGIIARASRLHGARIDLPYPSVGATETVLLSAVRAEGKTVLRNAATEPEVVELALFLQRMGAHIELSPDRRIVIEGVPRLRGASRWLAGDRLEAFSYLVAGLITRGEVRVHGCPQDRLVTAITTLAKMGAQIDITDEWITASAPSGLRPAAVHTDTHPGFMTDWQQPLMVLFTQAEGMSVLHETVFENRLVYVPALQEMGCEIETFAACLGGAGVPLPRHELGAFGGDQGRVQAARRRRHAARRAGRVLRRAGRGGGRPAVGAARHPPHRARLPPAVRAVRLARADHPARLRPRFDIPNGWLSCPYDHGFRSRRRRPARRPRGRHAARARPRRASGPTWWWAPRSGR